MFYGQSSVPYLSVEDAARILRVHPATLYRNLHDVDHIRLGTLIKVRCEWLFMEPPPLRVFRKDVPSVYQPTLPFEVKPVRVWRNTGKPVYLNPFGYPLKEK